MSHSLFLKRLDIFIKEYELNTELSQQLYQSICILEWVEGEPYWREEISLHAVREKMLRDFSGGFFEPVLMMRRREPRRNLLSALRRETAPTEERIVPVAKSLSDFHFSKKVEGISAWGEEPAQFFRHCERLIQRVIEPFSKQSAPYLDSFSQLLFGLRVGCYRRGFGFLL